MLFLCYPKCTTCLKARKWLDAHHVSYTERNIKTQNPTAAELRQWHAQSGLPLKRFFHTSGQLYRQMQLSAKIQTLPENELLVLLASDGMLVKRPILVTDSAVLVGFKEAEWCSALGFDHPNET